MVVRGGIAITAKRKKGKIVLMKVWKGREGPGTKG